ncbi:MAG: polyhydroxyalkanoate synthesis regulator DNA-binding domain-containing protein [Acidobacteria bacterium]|nr:polyhydroxyalkanoate synthesis regulator DNA-binding domain-containing protein [Acidobacteriota bacterium]MBI3658080.1 polyhydroxyalkanoate synthesis regulator DNA-binding domain-containing protein [Acidobacteriota bacterium]
MARIIKRYANRKLYDTEARQYVTLAALEALVREGKTVKVVEQSTGADVTYGVLSKIVSAVSSSEPEESKKNLLIELIKSPREAMVRYVKESVSAGLDTVSQVGEKIEQRIKGIIAPAEANGLDDVIGAYVSTLSAIIDERIKSALAQMDLPTRKDFERLERAVQSRRRRSAAHGNNSAASRGRSVSNKSRKSSAKPALEKN